MANVRPAVVKASRLSKRDGKWANKPEISQRIVGRKPENLGDNLHELVKKGSIVKKQNAQLWRPNNVAGAGGGSRGSRGKDGRDGGDRTHRDTTHRDTTKSSRRTTGNMARGAIGIGVAGGLRGGVTSSISRILM
jgi:hypothetical protein